MWVFGVWAPHEEVAKLTYFGLYALQHRGQESAGIAVSKGSQIVVFKDMGLVSQVFNEATLDSLGNAHVAIGHCRYSTTGASVWKNAQPTFRSTAIGSIALGHNGNLTNSLELQSWLTERDKHSGSLLPGSLSNDATSDTSLITGLLATFPGLSTEEAALQVLPRLRGAFSLVFMDEETLYAARDPQGIRPLVLGRLERGWVVASETAALDIVGATFIREVTPGVDRGRCQWAAESYLRQGRSEGLPVRVRLPGPAGHHDLGSPVALGAGRGGPYARAGISCGGRSGDPGPGVGHPGSHWYAEASGIPYGQGLVKNSYVGRTFIQPSQTIRQLGIRLKLNPLRDVIAGKRLVVVDDTIVRGNTQRALVRMLREAGASEVHVRISAPPVKWPCFYGIDFATRAELIANGLDTEEICRSIGADSLGYVSLEGLVAATQVGKQALCRACFDGVYPVELPLSARLGKSILEETAADLEPVVAGAGAADALTRP